MMDTIITASGNQVNTARDKNNTADGKLLFYSEIYF